MADKETKDKDTKETKEKKANNKESTKDTPKETPKESKKKKKDKEKDEKKPQWEELDPSIIKGRLILTDEQKEILEQFKKNVADCKRPYHNDGELCRWLVARDWDLKKATFMFTESMKWRTQEGIDDILETLPKTSEYFPLLLEYWPHSIHAPQRSYTRDGWPVIYERFGKLDLDLAELVPLRHLMLFHMYTIERIEEERKKCVEAHGFPMGFVLVQDLDGLGLDHISPNGVKIFKNIAKIDQDNFPEGLRKVFFINTPKIFQMAWKLVKSAIDDGVVAKFCFFGGKEEYLPELLKVVSEDNIPIEYGGKQQVDLPPGGSVKKYRQQAKEIRAREKEKLAKAGLKEKELVLKEEEGDKEVEKEVEEVKKATKKS